MEKHPGIRIEKDTMGEIAVPSEALWGAQTQRSLAHFRIGSQRFSPLFIHAFALVKKAAAMTNRELGALDDTRADLIVRACDEILAGRHDEQFPLSVWQTGSGTQTNMNLNEVIANRGNELAGGKRGEHAPLHPNDHVNRAQSSNDVFPTVMHVAASQLLQDSLLPALDALIAELARKGSEFADDLKSGRTHMMDATPVTLGQEFGGYRAQMEYARVRLAEGMTGLAQLAIGGSAVGTGLNTDARWAEQVTRQISDLCGITFVSAPDKFMALAAHDALVDMHGRLNLLATALFKMASDIRLMNSGPRCGLAEISIPANEPGSSIMPGKVNPTQVEALTMVCLRVMGNNTTVAMAGSQGHFELNVFKPLLIHTLLESMELLSDAMNGFREHCLKGIVANREQLARFVERSLMLVTILTPEIGYENAARAAKYADEKDVSLKEAVVALGYLTGAQFDEKVDPRNMLFPFSPKHG
ncbi:MAG: class II fumarate hydratase [Gammaproteobacteria bacterium]|nr:class II fumarate hydratase [Gammaproteobacteria bacterium]MDP2140051.1 class II fumarate hydratase [Gammaproteobacteria bacterium]MDP2347614.1 class II fumarate hydratase [Gammaproteobacteria bacterium]